MITGIRKTLFLLTTLPLGITALGNCGGGSEFDNPPSVAGSYSKTADICTDSFFEMPSTIDVEQIGATIEIEPGIGSDLEGTIDNNGKIEVEDAGEGIKCVGDYDENDDTVFLDCEFDDNDCSATYELSFEPAIINS